MLPLLLCSSIDCVLCGKLNVGKEYISIKVQVLSYISPMVALWCHQNNSC